MGIAFSIDEHEANTHPSTASHASQQKQLRLVRLYRQSQLKTHPQRQLHGQPTMLLAKDGHCIMVKS